MIDVIAFDADDTLWHTEPYYDEAEQKFARLLQAQGVPTEAALAELHRLEIDNLPYFGYGIRCFILSMIEAAVHVTGGQVSGDKVLAMVEMGKDMTGHPIRLLDGVQEALAALASRRLLLITKGDALDQESKVARSGLAGYFPAVEVVVDKTRPVYEHLLARHAVDPRCFLMVGNSLRSDIVPVLEMGGYAVYVPYPDGWLHDSAVDLPEDRSRYFEIASLRELPALIKKIDN